MGKKSKEKDKQDTPSQDDETPNVGFQELELSYKEKLRYVNVIAKPIATKAQAKKIYKLIKKASKEKGYLRSGLKDVQKRIRYGEKGLCIFAGNTSPIDIMVHMPGVCEEKNIPYCYTPSRQDLGTAMGVKRGSVMVLIRPHESYKELYNEVHQELKSMTVIVDKDFELPQGHL